MLAPRCDFTLPLEGGREGSGMQALPLERPLPYHLAEGPVWFRPTVAPWLAARRNLEQLAGAGRRIVLLAAERSLGAPDAPEAARLLGHGVLFALSLDGLHGAHGRAAQTRARALLAAPGVHLLVSLAADEPSRQSAWAAFTPEAHGIGGDALRLLTEDNWARIAAAEPVSPVPASPPRPGFFRRILGRRAPGPAAAGPA